jgi:hypothetical protein
MTKARDLANAATALSAVSATELAFLDGVTSAVQTQINTKQAVVSGVDDTELGYLNGVTSAVQTQLDAKAASAGNATQAGTETLTNKTLTAPTINDAVTNYPTFKAPTETANIVASAATGTIPINVETSTLWYYTSNATANHTLNFRYNSGTSLSSKLSVGETITVVWISPNGATAYYPNVIQVDGTTVTPKIQGGTAITGGNASSTDIYSFTIIKTAETPTYLVLESQTKFV